MSDLLVVTIPPEGYFYSLYADGLYTQKLYEKETGMTHLYYEPGAVVFLYYTYPTHRRVYLIRDNEENGELKNLPGVSKKVSVIFKQYASRVDKTKRAVSYLNTHYRGAYRYSDKFYIRLSVILLERGKIDYAAIDALCKRGL
jgi:hypothetical protein